MDKALFDLTGKRALVGGGGGDLGSAMVKALHRAGAHVVVLYRQTPPGWLAEPRDSGAPLLQGVQADLTRPDELEPGFRQALARLGGIDVLVNCQGVQRRYPPEEFPMEVWDEVLSVNLTSVFALCQLAGREMIGQGYGKIINLASMQSFTGGTNIPAYAASKGGVAILTKSLANAWARYGVTVNAIAPGYFDTKMTAGVKNDPIRYEQILSRIPAGHWGDPEAICGPLIFLASAASDYVNGVVLPVDGGLLGNL